MCHALFLVHKTKIYAKSCGEIEQGQRCAGRTVAILQRLIRDGLRIR